MAAAAVFFAAGPFFSDITVGVAIGVEVLRGGCLRGNAERRVAAAFLALAVVAVGDGGKEKRAASRAVEPGFWGFAHVVP